MQILLPTPPLRCVNWKANNEETIYDIMGLVKQTLKNVRYLKNVKFKIVCHVHNETLLVNDIRK